MKKELQVKGSFEDGFFQPKEIKITKEIASAKENNHLKLKVGYVAFGGGCDKDCPEDTTSGYYLCVSGNCVFMPFG